MRTHVCHLLAVALLLSIAPIAQADLIIARSFEHGGSMPATASIPIWVEFTTDQFASGPPVAPLFYQGFSPADLGKTFVADISTPYFLENIALATDGINNRVNFRDGEPYEASFFFGAPHSPFYLGKPDLNGFNINRVTLRVDEMTLTPTRFLELPPDWLDFTFKGTVTFEGTGSWPPEPPVKGSDENTPGPPVDGIENSPQGTPEPASVCLATLGALGLVVWRRNRKHSAREST